MQAEFLLKLSIATHIRQGNLGRGGESQLASLKRGLADEKTLKALGITYGSDGLLNFDKDVLEESLQNDYAWTKEQISGQFGIAQTAAQKVDRFLSESIDRIVDTSAYSSSSGGRDYDDYTLDNFRYMAKFNKGGAYNSSNMYAVGLLLNTSA